MSSKKKSKAKAKQKAEKAAYIEKPQEAVKAAEPQMIEKQEVPEWKAKEPEIVVLESETKKVSKGWSVVAVCIGVILAVTVIVLGVGLYHTSKELKAVQTMSGDLHDDIEQTSQKIDKLILAVTEDNNVIEEDTLSEFVPSEDLKPTATPRPTPVPEVYTICIDAGHGGYDTGAVLTEEREDGLSEEDALVLRREKDDNLWFAKLLQKELEAYGIKVIMTRDEDTFMELYERTEVANSMDADALISIHRNAYYLGGKMTDRVSGAEIWVHSSRPVDASQLAGELMGAIMRVGGMKDRGVKYGSMSDFEEDYAINRRAVMTSMIVEIGFVSSPADNEALDEHGEEYAKEMAKEIYEWVQTLR